MVVIKFHISMEILRQLYNFLLPYTQDSLNVWSFETFQLKCQRLWVILSSAKDDNTNKFVTEKTEAVLKQNYKRGDKLITLNKSISFENPKHIGYCFRIISQAQKIYYLVVHFFYHDSKKIQGKAQKIIVISAYRKFIFIC